MVVSKRHPIDKIFYVMGELKAFTVCQVLAMSLVTFPSSFPMLSTIFVCRNVPHRCALAPNDSSQLLSGLDGYRYEHLNISYHQCHIVVSYNDTVLKTEECIYGMAYDDPKDTSAVSQFDLVCAHSSLAGLSQTLAVAGQGIGATLFTMLSDRFGRKPVMVWCNFGLLICGLVNAYAPNYTVFAMFKFVLGALTQGCAMTFTALFMEMLTTKNRRLQASISGVMWAIPNISLPLLAFVFRHHSWRTLQMTMSLFSIPFIFQLWYCRESLRWLIANGKSKAVTGFIRAATKQNKTNFESTIQAYEETCQFVQEGEADTGSMDTKGKHKSTKKLTLFDLLKTKRLLLTASIMWLAWFTAALSYYAIYLTSTSLAGNSYLNVFLTALTEIPHNLVLFFIINRYGRKVTLIAVFFTVSTGITATGIFRSFEQTTINSTMALVFSCVAMTGASSAFCFVYFYTTELFPTNMRNQALGLSSFMGRFGGMIAPFTGVLSQKAKWAPGVLIGFLAFFICLLSVFLPETSGRELPQTIDDAKSWYSKTRNSEEALDDYENKKDSLVIQ